MQNNTKKPTISHPKRMAREQFYKKLSSQRKLVSQDIKDLRVLNTLKNGFSGEQLEFDLSETDRRALEKHNEYMETTTTEKINTIQGDIRLASAIARGKNG